MTNARIAIDGPVASGKSTIGRNLAEALGYLYLDTGAMYRGITALALDSGIDPGQEQEVADLAMRTVFSFPTLGSADAVNPPLLANGVDITGSLRLPQVDRAVSAVSSYQRVRQVLVEQQRQIAAGRSVVMVGRDIGTVVLPDAEVKIFLTASVEERATRRYQERQGGASAEGYEQTFDDLRRRDRRDSERAISPLRAADDAIEVDTTGYQSERSFAEVLAVVRRRLAECNL